MGLAFITAVRLAAQQSSPATRPQRPGSQRPGTRPLTATASPGRHGTPVLCPATATSAATAAAHTVRRGCRSHYRGKLPAHLSRPDRPRDTGLRVCRAQEGRAPCGILWDRSLATWEHILFPRPGTARLKMELNSLSCCCCLSIPSLPHSSGLVCCSIQQLKEVSSPARKLFFQELENLHPPNPAALT